MALPLDLPRWGGFLVAAGLGLVACDAGALAAALPLGDFTAGFAGAALSPSKYLLFFLAGVSCEHPWVKVCSSGLRVTALQVLTALPLQGTSFVAVGLPSLLKAFSSKQARPSICTNMTTATGSCSLVRRVPFWQEPWQTILLPWLQQVPWHWLCFETCHSLGPWSLHSVLSLHSASSVSGSN